MIIDISDVPTEPTNVICLYEVASRFRPGACQHTQVEVDEMLAEVKCKCCGERLNPIAVLARLAREESRFEWRRQELDVARKRFEQKTKTTCEHCGRMTRIKTPR